MTITIETNEAFPEEVATLLRYLKKEGWQYHADQVPEGAENA